jgi:gluconokinase
MPAGQLLLCITPPPRPPLQGHASGRRPAGSRLRAVILIVAGVSGTGKTTIGTLVAKLLGWPFTDGDSFHSEANIAKMRAGIPLTDADRQPWLRAMDDWMDSRIAAGQSAVISCSALKRAYRDELLAGRPAATMVFLEVDRDVLAQRLISRPGHFFHEELLDSQFAALEPPVNEERVLTVLEDGDATHTMAEIIALLWPNGRDGVAWTGESDAGPA